MRTPVLDPEEIHVWFVALDRIRVTEATDILDDSELRRATGIRHRAGRFRYLSAHLALRTLLAGYLGVAPQLPRFERRCPDPDECGGCGTGKPALRAGPWPEFDINLSHSGSAALLALCRAPGAVGVDIERIRSHFDWSRVPAVGPSARVAGFRTWTGIEAVGKAAGTGLRDMAAIGPPGPGGIRRARLPGDVSDWYVSEVECPDGYVGSLATNRPGVTVRTYHWPPIDP
ncbi:4'-phosphopantetheinyl transferase family protein [Streptomyces spiramyceticus]|uniref:4'-phosphopantetheinyl transferase family protein n=1 Tax=Streptomyces spiramyceticus TaxID=299717 RepID=UPI00237B60FB|nr:hypothetical protein [Streptomyces spiramyceticus]